MQTRHTPGPGSRARQARLSSERGDAGVDPELLQPPSGRERSRRRGRCCRGRRARLRRGAEGDWGDEGQILAHVGIPKAYSFHMALSYSRDSFDCFTTSQDLATFFACNRQAFAHFGGVPTSSSTTVGVHLKVHRQVRLSARTRLGRLTRTPTTTEPRPSDATSRRARPYRCTRSGRIRRALRLRRAGRLPGSC